MSSRTTRFKTPIATRNPPETSVPTAPPMLLSSPLSETTPSTIHFTARPSATAMRRTTVEWPSEKKKPTPTGLRPFWRSFRVVLSIAEMWSASNACRNPNVYARPPSARKPGCLAPYSRSKPQPRRCRTATEPKKPTMRRRSPRSNDRLKSTATEAIRRSLTLIGNESQLRIRIAPLQLRLDRAKGRAVGFEMVDLDQLPPQLRLALKYLDGAVKSREPAIRARVVRLRTIHPHLTSEQLARELIRS